MNNTINYQQIYEEDLSSQLKESVERPDRFFELNHDDRTFVEELIDLGYQRAIEDALDREVLTETTALSQEMALQLKSFAEVITTYLGSHNSQDAD